VNRRAASCLPGDVLEALARFAERFIRREFRERFLHEAANRPVDLHRRVCHDIEKLFEHRYRDGPVHFRPSDRCLFLGWSAPIAVLSWTEVDAKMSRGGGGHLVIRTDGGGFYAEAEGFPPPLVYAGHSGEDRSAP
jgi:hypothetical protein